MANITSSLTWNTTDKVWDIEATHTAFAEPNWGIPVNTYVYKVYLDLELFREISTSLHAARAANTTRKQRLKNHILDNSKFVRVSDNKDLDIVSIDSLVDEVDSKITTDVYSEWTDYTKLDPTDGSESLEAVTGTKDGDGLWLGILGIVMRKHSLEHLPLSGYYYFRTNELDTSRVNYDSAKKILNNVLHYLEWRTKGNPLTNNYLPLSVGVVSVTPTREFSPNSTIVTNLVAGDVIRISISGGSGEYTIAPASESSSLIESLDTSLRSWRVVTNSTTSISLNVNDDSIPNLAETITLNVIIKES